MGHLVWPGIRKIILVMVCSEREGDGFTVRFLGLFHFLDCKRRRRKGERMWRRRRRWTGEHSSSHTSSNRPMAVSVDPEIHRNL